VKKTKKAKARRRRRAPPAAPAPPVPAALTPRPLGRPTKLTPEVQESLVQMVRAGNYAETAAAYAGVDKTTLYDWLKRGRADRLADTESPHADFSHAVEKALAHAEITDVLHIGAAAADKAHWPAAAWRLERRDPKKWGRRDKLALTGGDEDDAPLEVQVVLSTRPARRAADEEGPDDGGTQDGP
jgi:transposase-like protein